jgi:hypothetical protein
MIFFRLLELGDHSLMREHLKKDEDLGFCKQGDHFGRMEMRLILRNTLICPNAKNGLRDTWSTVKARLQWQSCKIRCLISRDTGSSYKQHYIV